MTRLNVYPHLTAKDRDRVSFPTRTLWRRGCIQGRVLDVGCGYGADVRFLQRHGVEVVGYDPHYAPERPDGRFDTILCHYVLNVLFPSAQSHVLMNVAEWLRPGGTAFYTVRRDLRRSGFRLHHIHRRETYQTNVRLPFPTELRTKFCEIYRYRHYSAMPHAASDCPFCDLAADVRVVTESAQAVAIRDKYPVTEGHTLVLPKRHVADYFDLHPDEQRACWMLVQRVRDRLADTHAPDGFTVGINAGAAAGQTVPHAHIHVIPRRTGDVPDPTGGVRGVIPGRANYLDENG